MVILDQCRKSPQRNWLKSSQNAYLANTMGFSKYGVGCVLGPKDFLDARGCGHPPMHAGNDNGTEPLTSATQTEEHRNLWTQTCGRLSKNKVLFESISLTFALH